MSENSVIKFAQKFLKTTDKFDGDRYILDTSLFQNILSFSVNFSPIDFLPLLTAYHWPHRYFYALFVLS